MTKPDYFSLPPLSISNKDLNENWSKYLQSKFNPAFERFSKITPPNYRPFLKSAVLDRGRKIRSYLYFLLRDDAPWGVADDAAIVAIEVMHEASILMDDLIDGEPYRHGIMCFSFEFGKDVALLTSGFMQMFGRDLLFRFFRSKYGNIKKKFIGSYVSEYFDVFGSPGEKGFPWWEKNVLPKTVNVFDVIAILLSENKKQRDFAIATFLNYFGKFYQISNDLSDVLFGDGHDRGKVMKITYSLPICIALRYASRKDKIKIRRMIGEMVAGKDLIALRKNLNYYCLIPCRTIFGKNFSQLLNSVCELEDKISPRKIRLITNIVQSTKDNNYWKYSYCLKQK